MAEFVPYNQGGPVSTGPASTSAGSSGQVEWYQVGGSTSDLRGSVPNDFGGPYYPTASQGGADFGSFDDEPPLLEELGVDLSGICKRSKGVLLGRLQGQEMEDLDIGGPLLFSAVLAASHLLWQGKVHFGIILGWSVLSAIVLWFVVKNISGDSTESRACNLGSCYSVLGYALLPMVLFSILSVLIPKGNLAAAAGALVSLWCAYLAARLFVQRSPVLTHYRNLIGYPCLLNYGAFALLTLY